MGTLRILGESGDTRVTWQSSDVSSVDEVRRRFEEIVREGYLVFELDEHTRDGVQIRTFDPHAKELRAFRPLAGGAVVTACAGC